LSWVYLSGDVGRNSVANESSCSGGEGAKRNRKKFEGGGDIMWLTMVQLARVVQHPQEERGGRQIMYY
jgi:hypothetical protein